MSERENVSALADTDMLLPPSYASWVEEVWEGQNLCASIIKN